MRLFSIGDIWRTEYVRCAGRMIFFYRKTWVPVPLRLCPPKSSHVPACDFEIRLMLNVGMSYHYEYNMCQATSEIWYCAILSNMRGYFLTSRTTRPWLALGLKSQLRNDVKELRRRTFWKQKRILGLVM